MLYNLFGFLLFLQGIAPDGCWHCNVGKWLDVPAQVAPSDAIVVLGGGRDRLPLGIELFQEGIAPELWYTGATEESIEIATVDTLWAMQMATEQGIPAEAVTFLATTSTWTDGEQIAATVKARGTRSILVVTDWYHGRRALCSIHHHLQDDAVQVYYQPVDTPGFGPDNWWLSENGAHTATTELYKIIFYWGYYGLAPWVC